MMTCVPRVLEKMYDKLYLAGKKQTGFKKRLYYWAFELAKHYKLDDNSAWYLLKHKLADKLIYIKWREAIGGNFDIVVSGGAAIQKHQAAFFNAIGMPVFINIRFCRRASGRVSTLVSQRDNFQHRLAG